jgi:hypothetical protein
MAKANTKGFVQHPISKGIYGLPQSGLLVNELLEKYLNKHGYFLNKDVPGLWNYITRPVQFAPLLTILALSTSVVNM